MIKHDYTVNDARREIRECIKEGYGFDYICTFLNDLARGKDITWEEKRTLMRELSLYYTLNGFDGFGTLGE